MNVRPTLAQWNGVSFNPITEYWYCFEGKGDLSRPAEPSAAIRTRAGLKRRGILLDHYKETCSYFKQQPCAAGGRVTACQSL